MGWGIDFKNKLIIRLLNLFKIEVKYDDYISRITKRELESKKEELESYIKIHEQQLLILSMQNSKDNLLYSFNEIIEDYKSDVILLNKIVTALEDYSYVEEDI